jgi:hypothetical protein
MPVLAAKYWETVARIALKTTTHRREYPKVAPATETLANVAGPQATALITQAGPIFLKYVQ